ncbi:MAG TPA: ATP-dependent DNA helicase, partial [Acidimicrobiales bacterium]|nr:ATP-dependent DNA helicase [Acidimicrobiales bacterium]
MNGADDIADILREVAATLPGGGENRAGQVDMAQAVARAIKLERHLVVRAGTGTGKSLAYLVPLVLSGSKCVVATATKHLQDQLAGKDLPQLADAFGARYRFDFAVLKGRANYLCRQRLAELSGGRSGSASTAVGTENHDGDEAATTGDGLLFAELAGLSDSEEVEADSAAEPGAVADQVWRLVAWADVTASGDRAEAPFEPHPRAWASVSVTARECPGAYRCPSGPDCFTELARAKAAAADVVVVNAHLYAAHLAAEGAVLPEHDVVVFDEAQAVEDIMTEGLGVDLTPGRLRAAASSARRLCAADDHAVADGVAEIADRLDQVLATLVGRRVLRQAAAGYDTDTDSDSDSHRHTDNEGATLTAADSEGELRSLLELAAGRLRALVGALRRAGARQPDDTAPAGTEESARRARVLLACSHLLDDVMAFSNLQEDRVAWVEAAGPGGRWRTLRDAPVEVGPILAEKLWPSVTAVLTSATVPPLLRQRIGLPGGSSDELDVGSPFPYKTNALLYCAAHLPDRRRSESEPALRDELAELIAAAGGRTLALFTSWRAMREAAQALRQRLAFPILAQGDRPKPALVAAFSVEESACLFATMSFWQGLDVPGPTLSLLSIDRIPFPRPDDPLLEARRELA